MRAKAINHQHHAFRLDGRSEFRGRLVQKRVFAFLCACGQVRAYEDAPDRCSDGTTVNWF